MAGAFFLFSPSSNNSFDATDRYDSWMFMWRKKFSALSSFWNIFSNCFHKRFFRSFFSALMCAGSGIYLSHFIHCCVINLPLVSFDRRREIFICKLYFLDAVVWEMNFQFQCRALTLESTHGRCCQAKL